MGVIHTVLSSMGNNKVMRVRGSWVKVGRTGGKLQIWPYSAETAQEGLGPEKEHGGSGSQRHNQRTNG